MEKVATLPKTHVTGTPGPDFGTWESNPARTTTPLHLWHLCSLDAPTVAVIWACAFAWAAHVPLRPWAAAALGLIVFAIYVADRLLDVRSEKHDLRERHFFHWRHRHLLLPLAALAAVAAASLVWVQLPARSIRPDSLIAAATVLWLGSVHIIGRPFASLRRRLYPIIVGALFAAGCALPVCSQLAAFHSLTQFLKLPLAPILALAALAALNLQAIHEWESRQWNPHPASRIRPAAILLALASLSLAIFAPPRSAALLAAAAISALLLLILDRNQKQLSPLTLRAAADLVLLTPLLALLVP
jgi:hypothetical protein